MLNNNSYLLKITGIVFSLIVTVVLGLFIGAKINGSNGLNQAQTSSTILPYVPETQGQVAGAVVTDINATPTVYKAKVRVYYPTPTEPPSGIPEGGWGNGQQPQNNPNSIYQQPQSSNTNGYLDNQATQNNQQGQTQQSSDQQCAELKSQRNAALAPIEAQINETKYLLYSVEERVNTRVQGQFVSETQRLNMIDAERAELHHKLNQLQNEYNSVYAQYGSC